jgi:hypothetical protein
MTARIPASFPADLPPGAWRVLSVGAHVCLFHHDHDGNRSVSPFDPHRAEELGRELITVAAAHARAMARQSEG